MGLLKGTVSVRVFRVEGNPPEGFRWTYADALSAEGFHAPAKRSLAPVSGFVRVDSMLEVDFQDPGTWEFGHILAWQLRTDTRRLPGIAFKAHLKKQIADWCTEAGRARAPQAVRVEIKDRLEQEWLQEVLPSTRLVEVAWDTASRELLVFHTADAVSNLVRKAFKRCFGFDTAPVDSLGLDTERVEALAALTPACFRG